MMDHAPSGAFQNEDVGGCEVRRLIAGRLVAVDNRGIAKELNAWLLARSLLFFTTSQENRASSAA
jgi:hypothetical protein